jgi:hypothetical protein
MYNILVVLIGAFPHLVLDICSKAFQKQLVELYRYDYIIWWYFYKL